MNVEFHLFLLFLTHSIGALWEVSNSDMFLIEGALGVM